MTKERLILIGIAVMILGVIVFEAKRAIKETPVTDPASVAEEMYAGISSKGLLEKIQQGNDFILVDLRTPVEYNRGHIAGAINIPIADIEKHVGGLSRDKETILYCKSGPWSRQAYSILKKNGFNNIKVLENGIVGWKWEVNGEVVATSQS